MSSLLYVFLGGGLGSLCRYGVGKIWETSHYGTLTANIISCLVLGVLIGLTSHEILKSEHRLLWMTGFCGGFSTFSTFSGEIVKLYQDGQLVVAGMYMIGSIIAGITCIVLGMTLARAVIN